MQESQGVWKYCNARQPKIFAILPIWQKVCYFPIKLAFLTASQSVRVFKDNRRLKMADKFSRKSLPGLKILIKLEPKLLTKPQTERLENSVVELF